MAFQQASLTSATYDTHIEIFMAMRDVELRYGINSRSMGAKIPPSQFKLTVIGFWKPPGALRWVEHCATETVYKEKNPRFAMKMYLNCDDQDAAGIELKFQLLEGDYFGPQKTVFNHTLGYIQTTMSRLLAVGSFGLLTPLEIPEESAMVNAQGHKLTNGQCFLRAEVFKPIDEAVVFQFGIIQRQGPSINFFSRKGTSYYLEILKINEGTNFEINQPYTLVHRTEPMHSGTNCWGPIVLPLVRLCNGDWDRVLKLVIYDTNQTFLVDGERVKVGIILTTLRKLMEVVDNNSNPTGRMLKIIKFKDGKESQKISLMVNQCSMMQLAPFQSYLSNGLAIRRIYAVDYSKSNWNQALHKCNLHESAADHPSGGSGNPTLSAAPYEQALEIIAKMMQQLGSGQSVFYTFGNPQMRPMVETIEEHNHMKHLFNLYGDALTEAKQSDITGADDYAADLCFHKKSHALHNPNPQRKRTTLLTPLLNDLLALLSMRPSSQMEYFVAFIFTDAEITDLEESMNVIIQLAKHPISLIFIAVGLGNLEFPLSLQEGWVHPTTNEFPRRNIITVIHFRSLQNWFSAIQYGSQFKSDPLVLLQKEIFNAIDKQAVQFLRVVGT